MEDNEKVEPINDEAEVEVEDLPVTSGAVEHVVGGAAPLGGTEVG